MRTIEEIGPEVIQATVFNDVKALVRLSEELDGLKQPKADVISNNARAVVSYIQNDCPAALEYFQASLAIHQEHDDLKGVSNAYVNIGRLHFDTGAYPLALESFQKALGGYEELGHHHGIVRSKSSIAGVYNNAGDYPTALELYQSALDVCADAGDRRSEAATVSSIGNVYFELGDYAASLEHYEKALAVFLEFNEPSGIAIAYGNIGGVNLKTGQYSKALEYFHRALEIHREHGERDHVSRISGNMIGTYIKDGAFEKARELLHVADESSNDSPVTTSALEVYRAQIYEHDNNDEEAAKALELGLAISVEHGLRAQEAEVHAAMRDLALKQNDLARYVKHNDAYTRITDEIRGREATQRLTVQAKQREIDAERKEHEKQLAVLHSTLPKDIADRVARGETVSDQHDNASVIFVDIVGFTSKSSEMDSNDVTKLLAEIFDQFDAICTKNNITKIKTIGDSYMAVGFDAVIDTAEAALEMQASKFTWPDKSPLEYRIGIHCGPVTAGVIGTQRLQYDVWGDTVNVASRMESSGEPGRIHASETFATSIPHPVTSGDIPLHEGEGAIRTFERGTIDIKGKGPMKTFWLEGATR